MTPDEGSSAIALGFHYSLRMRQGNRRKDSSALDEGHLHRHCEGLLAAPRVGDVIGE